MADSGGRLLARCPHLTHSLTSRVTKLVVGPLIFDGLLTSFIGALLPLFSLRVQN